MSTAGTTTEIASLLEHTGWVRRLAFSLVRDDALADELAQDTWLVALRHAPQDDQPARAWLGVVLRNVLRMKLRGERRRDEREKAVQVGEPVYAAGADELLERAGLQQTVMGLVMQLPEPFRTTLLLRYQEGLNATEIAVRQQMPAGTVRWRLKEGIERVRVGLDRKHAGDRRSWQRALTPIVTAPLGATGGISSAATIKGAFAMSAAMKVGAITAGLALAYFATRSALPVPSSVGPAARQPAATLARTQPAPSQAEVAGRFDAKSREQLLGRIREAHRVVAAGNGGIPGGVPAPVGHLEPEYIQDQIRELKPLLKACYDDALRGQPELHGKIVVAFTILGEADVGGLIGESKVDPENSSISDKSMLECVQETMHAARFPPPVGGGEVRVSYPFQFDPK